MKKFFLVIGKDKFFIYSRDNKGVEPVFIDGNPFRQYNPQNIKQDMTDLLEYLADAYNEASTDELEFSVVENSDRVCTANVSSVLGNRMKEQFSLDKIIANGMHHLQNDVSLHIKDYGVNYDGNSYKLEGDMAKKVEYSLLGFRLEPKQIMEYC